MLVPHVVEREIVQDDGSVVKRLGCSMGVCRNEHSNWCLLRQTEAWCDSTLLTLDVAV